MLGCFAARLKPCPSHRKTDSEVFSTFKAVVMQVRRSTGATVVAPAAALSCGAMRWRASLGLLAAVAIMAASPAWSAKKRGAPLQLVPDQHAEIADLLVPPAAQDCFNWSWAAGIEAMLRAQKVESLPQSYFIRKLYPGDLCVDEAVDFERLGRAVDGEYVVDAGRKVRLESRFTPGPPTIP